MVYTNLAPSHKRRRIGFCPGFVISCALAGALAWPASAAASDRSAKALALRRGSPSRVRSTDAAVLALFREGAERSATFGALIDAVDHSNGIVYVEFGYCGFGHLNGCLLPFVAASHGDRYLRVVVTPDKTRRSHDQLLALIAHELRHALEVIEHEEVVNAATMDAMYRRIGTPLTGRLTGYETSAARASGHAVLSELLTKRP
jgi:hypothetical protein